MQTVDRQAAAAATRAHQQGQYEAAQKGYTSHLARYPEDAGIWSNLGALFRTTKRYDQALRAQRRARALSPRDAGIRNNLANILSDIGQYEESIELRQESLKADPTAMHQHAMIGRCLRGLGRYEQAIAYLTPLVGKHPEEPEIELQLAFAQLGAGQYGAAFRSYLIRWHCEELSPRVLERPQWKPGDDLNGKTVLILPEQGFGDAVLMSRFVSILAEKGAKPYFLAEKPMMRLFEGLPGAEWVGRETKLDARFDYWMNLMDLPLAALEPDHTGSPPPPTSLNTPADSIARAKGIVAPHKDKFKVGVVWSGSATYKGNAFRSFTHNEFMPLTDIPGVQLFSLYKGPFLEQFYRDGAEAFIVDAAGTDRDFADCAATMHEMDLIITSDTATAHIAGTLGVPVWTVLHWDAFWVFRHAGETTDWYPSMRLFRQEVPRDWSAPFAKVEAALRDLVKERP